MGLSWQAHVGNEAPFAAKQSRILEAWNWLTDAELAHALRHAPSVLVNVDPEPRSCQRDAFDLDVELMRPRAHRDEGARGWVVDEVLAIDRVDPVEVGDVGAEDGGFKDLFQARA